jgi:hypothetical protein
MYNDDPNAANPNVSNKVLLLDTRISAFYTLTFPWDYTPEYGGLVDAIKASNNNIVSVTDNQVVVGADTVVVGSDFVVVQETSVSGSTYTGVPVGFLVYRPSGVTSHTLTNSSFYDFDLHPYSATIQTRYDLDGDALRKKHVLYVQPHFKKEIVTPPNPAEILELAWSKPLYMMDWLQFSSTDTYPSIVNFGDGTIVVCMGGPWTDDRQGLTYASGNPSPGLKITTDGGDTWNEPPVFPYEPDVDIYDYSATLVRLPNTDTLFVVSTTSETGDLYRIRISRSDDRGATWGASVIAYSVSGTVRTMNFGHAAIDSTGTIHIAVLSRAVSTGSKDHASYSRLPAPYTTATEPVEVGTFPLTAEKHALPSIVVAGDDSITVFYTEQDDLTASNGYAVHSTDSGTTWGTPVALYENKYFSNGILSAVSPSGTKIFSFNNADWASGFDAGLGPEVWTNVSLDSGATWSSPVSLLSAGVPNNASATARWLTESVLEVVFPRAHPTIANELVVSSIRSSDNGATWSAPADIMVPVDSGFAFRPYGQLQDLIVLNDAPVNTILGTEYTASLIALIRRDHLDASIDRGRAFFMKYATEDLNAPPFDINNGYVRLTVSPSGSFGEHQNNGVGLAFDPTGLGVWGTKNYMSMSHTTGTSKFADHGLLYRLPSNRQYEHETFTTYPSASHFDAGTWWDRPTVTQLSATTIQSVVEVEDGVFLTYTYEIPVGKKYIKVTVAVTAGSSNLTEVWYGRMLGGQPDWLSDGVSTATGTTISEDFVIVTGTTSGMSHGIYIPPGETVPATVSRNNGYTLDPWSLTQGIATTNYPSLQIAAWGGAPISAGQTQTLTYYIVFGTSAADVQANIPV